MHDYRHPNVAELVKRMREEPERFILVTGPRQSGKTTAVLQALDEVGLPSRYESVDPPGQTIFRGTPETLSSDRSNFGKRDASWIYRIWEATRSEAVRSQSGFILVIDEIQQIPNWARAVKGLWDADRRFDIPLRVVILGSAPLLLQKDLGDSLVGRFELLPFTHWSFTEMSAAFAFDLKEFVYYGGGPGSARIRDHLRWTQYVRTSLVEPVIQKDVLGITRVRKPALLKQVFDFCTKKSGQIVSYNSMLRHLQDAGNISTLARYLELLSKVELVSGLEQYSGSFVQTRKSSPKLTVLNTAFMGAYSELSFAEAQSNRRFWRHLVESAVGAHLLNTGRFFNTSVYYWQERNLEVHFVLKRGPYLAAIEVKSGPQLRSSQGLYHFSKKFPRAKRLVVGANGIPLSEFLSAPASHWVRE